MLDGITILYVSEGYIRSWGINGWILLCLFLGFILIINVILQYHKKEFEAAIVSLYIGFTVLFITICVASKAKIIETYPIYKVTIDETVTMRDFNERYEIISQEGLIYKIKEKRVDTN